MSDKMGEVKADLKNKIDEKKKTEMEEKEL